MSLDVGNLILALAGLSFIGLGAPPPAPELGAMSAQGLEYLLAYGVGADRTRRRRRTARARGQPAWRSSQSQTRPKDDLMKPRRPVQPAAALLALRLGGRRGCDRGLRSSSVDRRPLPAAPRRPAATSCGSPTWATCRCPTPTSSTTSRATRDPLDLRRSASPTPPSSSHDRRRPRDELDGLAGPPHLHLPPASRRPLPRRLAAHLAGGRRQLQAPARRQPGAGLHAQADRVDADARAR